MKRKRQRLLLILLLLVGIIGLGYAALSANLIINGIADIKATTWDVHFDNVNLTEGSATTTAPTIGTDKVSATFETTLSVPGDFYEFTIDVVNESSIDAMISDFDLGTLTTDQAKYLNYSVTYSDGVSISKKDLLASGSTEVIKVRIEFKSDVSSSDLPTSSETIIKNISLNYVQNEDGKLRIGSKFYIGTEGFYVISNDGTTVKAIAEWNLLVGNQTDGRTTTKLTKTTGLQDSSAKGLYYLSVTSNPTYPCFGTIAFSSSAYWDRVDGTTIDLTNGSNIIYPYLTAYKTSLTSFGGNVIDVSLITKEELVSLGCGVTNENGSCESAPSWIYKTTYWTRSGKVYGVWVVVSNSNFHGFAYQGDNYGGIRPVITLLASDIK